MSSLAIRALALGVGALFIMGGPFDRQVLGNRHKVFKSWRPYGGAWLEVCVAEYAVVGPDGQRTPVDAIQVLHDAAWWQVPLHRRRLTSRDDVRRTGRKLCGALDASDVRTQAKCATEVGFRYFERWGENLCAG